ISIWRAVGKYWNK
ncbi:hydroxymethylglutaryl-coenzyme A reductase family protein, partial [Vibrio parahaemolyticus V-223/04]